MKTRITIKKLIAITMAVAAIAVIGSIWAAGRADAAGQVALGDGSVRFVFPPIGLGRDQTLSYSFFNPNEEGSEPVRAQVTLYDEQGNEVWRSQEVEVFPRKIKVFYCPSDTSIMRGGKGAAIGVILGGAGGTGARCSASMEHVDNSTGSTGSYFAGTVSVSGD